MLVRRGRNGPLQSVAFLQTLDSCNDIFTGRVFETIALLGMRNDAALINSKIDKLFNMAEDLGLAEIVDMEMEIIHL